MTSNANHRSVDLAERYMRLTALYGKAKEVANAMPAQFDIGSSAQDQLDQLSALMEQVAEIERSLPQGRPADESAKPSGGAPPYEIASVVEELRATLRDAIESIRIAEEHARAAKDRLSPRLNSESARRRMQSAYSAQSRYST